ncbi:MAG: cytochrome c-type biogenesis protein, partial [Pseudomonadota bacterium]
MMARLKSVFAAVYCVLIFSLTGASAFATGVDVEVLEDPAKEAFAREVMAGIRCLVCQNQSIDDSNADLARDLRQLVRERLLAGDTDEEILAFVTERYGDFVLLCPPMKPSTWLLWYGPVAIFVLAGIA